MNNSNHVRGDGLVPIEAVTSAPVHEVILHHFCSQPYHGRFRVMPGIHIGIESVHEEMSRIPFRAPQWTPLPQHRAEW